MIQHEDELRGMLPDEILAEVDRLRAALERIRRDYGKVCPEFETCDHPACASSVGAWFEADRALKGAMS